MCNWCNKESIGKPQWVGYFIKFVCEHCGKDIYKEKFVTFKTLKTWAIKYAISKGYKKEDC